MSSSSGFSKYDRKETGQSIYCYKDTDILINKENIRKGSTEFSKSQFIEEILEVLFDELAKDMFLKGLNAEEFSQKAAYYLAELNMIHPFREGNGRSIREYIRQLALKCGHIINWSLIDSETLLEATIISVDKNYRPLENCIFKL